MVRVWDAGLNAWRDAKTIRRYDQERQAFVDVEAVYTTINGVKRQVWPNKLYLYKDGDECVVVTDGWIGKAVDGTAYRSTNYLYVKMDDFQGPEGTYNTRYAQFYTNQKVDLTPYNYLCIDGYYSGQGGHITIAETQVNNVYTTIAKTQKRYTPQSGSRGIKRYDISQISGEFYVGMFAMWTSSDQSKGQCWLYNLWLEA